MAWQLKGLKWFLIKDLGVFKGAWKNLSVIQPVTPCWRRNFIASVNEKTKILRPPYAWCDMYIVFFSLLV